MKKLLKRLSLLYISFIAVFVCMGQLIADNGILTSAQIDCQSGTCIVSEKYLLNGKIFQKFSFNQADIKSMWLKEDMRGYYKLWSSFDKISQCLSCGDWELIHFPFNWWWKSNAETFIKTLNTESEIHYTQYNRTFSWLGTVLMISIILILGLYKLEKIK